MQGVNSVRGVHLDKGGKAAPEEDNEDADGGKGFAKMGSQPFAKLLVAAGNDFFTVSASDNDVGAFAIPHV